MATGICKNCKHWESSPETNLPKNLDLGKCRRVKMFWDCTEWGDECDDFQRLVKPCCAGEKAFVQDGSDYKAELITAPDFGCVQFESHNA